MLRPSVHSVYTCKEMKEEGKGERIGGERWGGKGGEWWREGEGGEGNGGERGEGGEGNGGERGGEGKKE